MSSLRSLLALFLISTASRAQSSAVVDEGTFMVAFRGAPVGRESFRIVRAPAPGGQVFRATGQSALGDKRITTSLGTDSLGVPISYESELTQKGEVIQRLRGRGRPGRLSVLVSTKTGESAREYVLNSDALLMDEDVFHHFYFVALAAGRANFSAISPRAGQQARFQVESRGQDSVEVAGRYLPSRHLALIGPSGQTREVWVDPKGRLLKVTLPEKGLVAVRDDPPR